MTREEIILKMDSAAKEDRERFFRVADVMAFQPKYETRKEALETVKQQWRDMTTLEGYPCVKWPLELPEWFPAVKFASQWGPDYLEKILAEQERHDEIVRGEGDDHT